MCKISSSYTEWLVKNFYFEFFVYTWLKINLSVCADCSVFKFSTKLNQTNIFSIVCPRYRE